MKGRFLAPRTQSEHGDTNYSLFAQTSDNFGPMLGQVNRGTRSLPSLDPARISLYRHGRPLRQQSLPSVGEAGTRSQLHSLRQAGCMATSTNWYQASTPSKSSLVQTTLPQVFNNSVPSASQASRGFVSMVSQVPLCAPAPVCDTKNSTSRSPNKHRIDMKADETSFWPSMTTVRKEGTPSPALQRSMNLQHNLHDMRRMRAGPVAEEPATVAQDLPDYLEYLNAPALSRAEESDVDDSVVITVLSELADTGEELRKLVQRMMENHDSAVKNGGARHPSTIQASRNLAVVQRKTQLVCEVEARGEAFEAADAHRIELFEKVFHGKGAVPDALTGLAAFVEKYTHRGNPAEASCSEYARSNFLAFAARFKLPAGHCSLESLKELGEDAGEWWADMCLKETEKGTGYVQLQRLLDAAMACGADKDHYKLVRAIKIVCDMLADHVLEQAKERVEHDKETIGQSTCPRPGPASAAADKIEEDLKLAQSQGVPLSDKRMVAAKALAQKLREEDGVRKRLANREKRLADKA